MMYKKAMAMTMKAKNFTILALRRWRLWRRRTARTITTMATTRESSVVIRAKVPARLLGLQEALVALMRLRFLESTFCP